MLNKMANSLTVCFIVDYYHQLASINFIYILGAISPTNQNRLFQEVSLNHLHFLFFFYSSWWPMVVWCWSLFDFSSLQKSFLMLLVFCSWKSDYVLVCVCTCPTIATSHRHFQSSNTICSLTKLTKMQKWYPPFFVVLRTNGHISSDVSLYNLIVNLNLFFSFLLNLDLAHSFIRPLTVCVCHRLIS